MRLLRSLLLLLLIAAIGVGIGIVLRHHDQIAAPTQTSIPAGTDSSTTTSPPSSTPASSSPTSTLPATTTTTLPLVSPSSVLVQVLNGFGGKNAATNAATALRQAGFLINGTGDAAAFTYTASVVEYESGNLAAAETLAHHVMGAVELRLVTDLPAAKLIDLIVGSDFTGVSS
jgi:cytoskeletal protein RodZ